MSTVVGRRERKRQQTREQIVKAARELFVEQGYHETSLAEISERADVATSTLSGYFPTKADILFDGIDSARDAYIECLTSRDRATESAIEATSRWHKDAAHMFPVDLEWATQLNRIIHDDPVLGGQLDQRWKPSVDVLAREIAGELGDSPDSLRPRLIAGIKVTLYSSLAQRVLAEAASSSKTLALLEFWNDYVNDCLQAAADAIERVPLPGDSAANSSTP